MALLERLRSTPAPEPRRPLREPEELAERMRRMLDETFGGWPPRWFDAARALDDSVWSPLVDIEETDEAYVVEAELPGVKREDVDVELVGNELVIEGERKERERAGVLRRRTRLVGRFEYRVTLPEQIDAEKVEASLVDGVLTVRVPKSQRARRHRIEVTS